MGSRASKAPHQTPLSVVLRGLVAGDPEVVPHLRMPGRSHTGPLGAFSDEEQRLSAQLRADVEHLAITIGERNVWNPPLLRAAEAWLTEQLQAMGLDVRRQAYRVRNVECANLDAEIRGQDAGHDADGGGQASGEIVVIGSHYDAVRNCPAANDNGTGVAATLAIARHFAAKFRATGIAPRRTLRFAFFANEEPPFFWTEEMGSLVYAKACKQRGEKIIAMLTPETIGCYTDEPGTQHYPITLLNRWYPKEGNFIAFIGMSSAHKLVKRCVGTFRETTKFPSIGAALPSLVPGVGASDHWSFWQCGYPALMVTDTAPFRYEHYHFPTDTPDKIDFDKTARVVSGLVKVVEELVEGA